MRAGEPVPTSPEHGRSRARRGSARLALLGLGRRLNGLTVDRLRRVGAGRLRLTVDLGALVFGHALLEGLDARGEVTHQLRDLAAPAEQQQEHDDHEQPMYPAQGTHVTFPPRGQVAPRATYPRFSNRN